MDVRVITRITIDAEHQEVFNYLADLKYHYLWNPQTRKISPIVQLKKGSTYEVESMVLGVKMANVNKVSKFVKNQEIEIVNKGQFKYQVNFRLISVKTGTQVVCTTAVKDTSDYFLFAKPLLRKIVQRELQTDMKALKLAVEHKLT